MSRARKSQWWPHIFTRYGLYLVLTWMTSVQLSAQLYPVTANLNITPPYSPLFYTLSDGSLSPFRANKILLTLVLNDLNEPSLPVRLEWEITGPGGSFRTESAVLDHVFTLLPGQPVVVRNQDLTAYFDPSRLQGLDPTDFYGSGGYLHEGEWTFCVTAYELRRNSPVSNTACKTIFMEEFDPPVIIAPEDSVQPSFPQNLRISWQPLHFGAFPVQYTIRVWEDLPGMSPEQIINYTLPYHTTTVPQFTTVFLQGDAPLMYVGEAYWVEVQVKDLVNGPLGAPVYAFKNNGKSEIVRFVYGVQREEVCHRPVEVGYLEDSDQSVYVYWDSGEPPLLDAVGLDTTPTLLPGNAPVINIGPQKISGIGRDGSNTNVNIRTQESFFAGYYRVQWKDLATPVEDSWKEITTENKWIQWTGFKRGHSYQLVVRHVCSAQELSSDTLLVDFARLPQPRPYECNQPLVDVVIENQDPLPQLVPGDTLLAGDIRVVVTEAYGQNGLFSGIGYFPAPMLKSVKIGVEFSEVEINDEYRLIAGEIQSTYDETNSNVVSVDSLLAILQKAELEIEEVFLDGIIDTVFVDSTGQVVVIMEDGGSEAFGHPVKLTDSNGNSFVFSGGYVMPTVDLEEVPEVFPEGYRVTFSPHPDQRYGLDGYKPKLEATYEELQGGYKVPFKSIALGGNDQVIATAELDHPEAIDSILFVTESGVKLSHSILDSNRMLVNLSGIQQGTEHVLALIPNKGMIGVLNLVTYPLYDVKVHLVPVNGVGESLDLAALQSEVNQILRQGVFTVSMNREPGITDNDPDGLIQAENHFLSAYSPDMRRILQSYGPVADGNDFYLFLVDNLEGDVSGFMPKGSNRGFVDISAESVARTIAHELGHGAFTLDHSWEQFPDIPRGTSQNLMDYGSQGTELWYAQWAKMHNPDVEVPWLQDEKGGQSAFFADLISTREHDHYADENIRILSCLTKDAFDKGIIGREYKQADGIKNIRLGLSDIPLHFTKMGNLRAFKRGDDVYVAYWCRHQLVNNTLVGGADPRFIGYGPQGNADHYFVNKNLANLDETGNNPIKVLYDSVHCSIKVNDITHQAERCCNLSVIQNYSSIPFDTTQLAVLFRGEELINDRLGGLRHTLRAYLMVTDESTSQENEEYVSSFIPPDPYLKVWVHIEGGKYYLKTQQGLIEDVQAYLNSLDSTFSFSMEGLIDILGASAESVFTGLYEFLDFVSEGIRKARIPEYAWNCNNLEIYKPIYAKVYSYLTLPLYPARLQLEYILTTITDGSVNIDFAQVEFAMLCGIWNGAIEIVAGLPDLTKTIVGFAIAERRNEFFGMIQKLKTYEDADGNVGIWYGIKEGLGKQFDYSQPCFFAHNVTEIGLGIVIAFMSGGAAGGSVLTNSAGLIIKVLNKIEDITDAILIAPLKFVGGAGSKVCQVLFKNTKNTFVTIEGDIFRASLIINGRIQEVSHALDKFNFSNRIFEEVDGLGNVILKMDFPGGGGVASGRYPFSFSVVDNLVADALGISVDLYKRFRALGLSDKLLDDLLKKYFRPPPPSSADVANFAKILEENPVSDINGLAQDMVAETKFGEYVLGGKGVKAWESVRGLPEILRSNPNFLDNIMDFPQNRIDELNADLANSKWKDELTELFDESPNDVKNIWYELKERPDYHWEIKSSEGFTDQSRWQKWSQREFFKEVTKIGRVFETKLLEEMSQRSGKAYNRLKDFVPDLDQRKLISQVQFCLPGLTLPCNRKGEYFIADQVWLKFGEFDEIENIVIIDAKLKKSTDFSAGQTVAKDNVGGSLSYKIATPTSVDITNKALPTALKQGTKVKINSFYKAYGDGDKTFVNIE